MLYFPDYIYIGLYSTLLQHWLIFFKLIPEIKIDQVQISSLMNRTSLFSPSPSTHILSITAYSEDPKSPVTAPQKKKKKKKKKKPLVWGSGHWFSVWWLKEPNLIFFTFSQTKTFLKLLESWYHKKADIFLITHDQFHSWSVRKIFENVPGCGNHN